MKINQLKTEFQQVTITLETRAELEECLKALSAGYDIYFNNDTPIRLVPFLLPVKFDSFDIVLESIEELKHLHHLLGSQSFCYDLFDQLDEILKRCA